MGKDISTEDVEQAIRLILKWIGEDPNREGLIETPTRIIKSYAEKFRGYKIDPKDILSKTFSETSGYSDMIVLSNILVESHCEHHLAPIIGRAHIAYIPSGVVVGISKLARLVEVFSHRLQLQERLTSQVANAINDHLKPRGVAVLIEAEHHCIRHRGVKHDDTVMTTSCFLGDFSTNNDLVARFMSRVRTQ